MNEEAAFREQMAADHNDATVRGVYADWLDEHDRPDAARRLRWLAGMLDHPINKRESLSPRELHPAMQELPNWVQHLVHTHELRDRFAEPDHGASVRVRAYRDQVRGQLAGEELGAIGITNPPLLADGTPTHAHSMIEGMKREPSNAGVYHVKRVLDYAKINPPTPKKLARVKVPAGGQISGGGTVTGGVYQQGGQFGAKARKRIRATVVAWLKARGVARPVAPTGPEKLARQETRPTRLHIVHVQGNLTGAHHLDGTRPFKVYAYHPDISYPDKQPRWSATTKPKEYATLEEAQDKHPDATFDEQTRGGIGGRKLNDFEKALYLESPEDRVFEPTDGQAIPEFFHLAAKKSKLGDLHAADLHFDKPAQELEPEEKDKLPRTAAGDEAIHRAKDRAASDSVGGDPDVVASPKYIRSKLTIRELKDVESSLSLPPKLHLSTQHGNEERLDHEPVADIDQDTYYKWANDVARHIQKTGLTAHAADRLRDPKHLSKAKLAFIVDRLTREANGAKAAFADSGGAGKWYGDHVAVMARHLHDSFHQGDAHPEDDELWGKRDKKTGRVTGGAAITLAKMLVAATSGGMKPHDNYRVAHDMISSGLRAGAGSVNPFKSIPENQTESFGNWVDAVERWHEKAKTGVTRSAILHPGLSLHDRALWYERVIKPMAADAEANDAKIVGGDSETNQRYSGVTARYVAKQGPHFGAPVAIKKQDTWRSPYPSTTKKPVMNTVDPNDKAHLPNPPSQHDDYSAYLATTYPKRGEIRTGKLPAVDDMGKLVPPGWTNRGEQVNDGLDKINAVVNYFTHLHGSDREGMKGAAQFFLNTQSPASFEKVIEHTAGLDRANGAPTLADLTKTKTVKQAREWVAKVVQANETKGTGVTPADVHTAARLYAATKENNGFYFPGEHLPGSFLLGPKFGAFSMNLHLDQPPESFGLDRHDFDRRFGGHLTADLWWSRDWNVMLGSLFGPKDERAGTPDDRQETPRGKGASHPERKLMRKAAEIAAKRAGLNNVAELQAVLWYYEQQKPKWFGVDTSSTSYLDGANMVASDGRAGHVRKYSIHPTTGDINVESTY